MQGTTSGGTRGNEVSVGPISTTTLAFMRQISGAIYSGTLYYGHLDDLVKCPV